MVTPEPDPAVLDAVATILGRDGAGGLNLSAIAEEAGISRVTLHRRGLRIGPMIGAVVARASADLREALWGPLTSTDPAADRLGTALEVTCQVFEAHSGVLSALFHVPDGKTPTPTARRAGFDFIEPFERILSDGQADGTLRCTDPRSDAEVVVNAVTWSYLHLRRALGWPEDAARTRTIELAHRFFLHI